MIKVKTKYDILKDGADEVTDLARLTRGELNNPYVIPILTFEEEIIQKLFGKAKDRIVEFGYYPQEEVKQNLSDKLENKYSKNELVQIEGEYTILTYDISKSIKDPSTPWFSDITAKIKSTTYSVYKYEGEKYIRLSPYLWIKVLPIKWYLNLEKRALNAKDALISSLFVKGRINTTSTSSTSKNLFSEEETQRFIEEIFLKDVLNPVNNVKSIHYESFEKLKDIIHENDNFKSYEQIARLEFIGPKLSSKNIKSIKLLISSELDISFIEETKPLDGIKPLIDRIKEICSYLPESSQKMTIKRVDTLLKEYKTDLDDLKPTYKSYEKDFRDINFDKDIRTLKPTLQADLEAILLYLSSAEILIKFIKELDTYKKFITTGIYSFKKENSTDATIKNIIYMATKLDEEESKIFLDKLSMCIEGTKKSARLEIFKLYDENMLENQVNVEANFKVEISALYDEVYSEYKKMYPISTIFNGLNNVENTHQDNNDLTDIIDTVKALITNLYKNKTKVSLAEKYASLIDGILDDKLPGEDVESSPIEVTPIKIDKEGLLNQLEKSIKIVKENITNENDQLITSYVTEINNLILSDDLISDEEKLKIKNDLLQKISDSISFIEKRSINNLDDYNQVVMVIYGLLTEVELSMSLFVKRMNEFNKNI